MSHVALVWATPNGEQLLVDMARVSAPENKGFDGVKLIKYLIKNQHWSPFEMVNMVVEIETTRDIARQLLRHRSFSFQEFSQRYADVKKLAPTSTRKCRLQDYKNRQNSLETDDESLQKTWERMQEGVKEHSMRVYNAALEIGIAKEVARVVLPEGLTASRMYMNGTLRSWIHFLQVRLGNGTQRETQEVAKQIERLTGEVFPVSFKALMEN